MKLSQLFPLALAFVVLALIAPTSFAQEAVERQNSEAPALMEDQTPPPEETKPVKKKKVAAEEGAASDSTAPTAQSMGMTEEQFKAAGLDKLSPDELRNLAASMKGYKRKVETQATEKANEQVQKANQDVQKANEEAAAAKQEAKKQARKRVDMVESRVADPNLTHLSGHSIITLEDGTKWKQATRDDHYPVPYPNATTTVQRTSWGWKMRMAGVPEMYVDPVHEK